MRINSVVLVMNNHVSKIRYILVGALIMLAINALDILFIKRLSYTYYIQNPSMAGHEFLNKLLNSEDYSDRVHAYLILEKTRSDMGRKQALLDVSDANASRAAVAYLANIGERSVLPLLKELILDPKANEAVRKQLILYYYVMTGDRIGAKPGDVP